MSKSFLRAAGVLLATCVFSPPSGAEIRLNPRGEGQALHLPWFTVKDGQGSLISVRNTRNESKAVRVTLSEALNGVPVLSLNVYLPPNATWMAGLQDGEQGPRLLASGDACVLSMPSDLMLRLPDLMPDGGPRSVERLRTGAIDIVEMGVVGGEAGEQVAESDCAALRQSWLDGSWAANAQHQISAPTGGLSANAVIVKAEEGSSYALAATAIDGFSLQPRHASPAAVLRFSDASCGTPCDVRLPSGETVRTASGADAVNALLSAKVLHEEVHVESGLAARTHWIVSFPTRHAYLQGEQRPLKAPFEGVLNQGKACQPVEWRAWSTDGELAFPMGPEIVFIGAGRCGLQICGQTQALDIVPSDDYPFSEPPPACYFENGAQELTLLPLHDLEGGKGQGRLYLGVDQEDSATVPLEQVSGLPAVGFSVSEFTNANARPGVMATFNTAVPLGAD